MFVTLTDSIWLTGWQTVCLSSSSSTAGDRSMLEEEKNTKPTHTNTHTLPPWSRATMKCSGQTFIRTQGINNGGCRGTKEGRVWFCKLVYGHWSVWEQRHCVGTDLWGGDCVLLFAAGRKHKHTPPLGVVKGWNTHFRIDNSDNPRLRWSWRTRGSIKHNRFQCNVQDHSQRRLQLQMCTNTHCLLSVGPLKTSVFRFF